jgi:ribosomal protein L30/L7E
VRETLEALRLLQRRESACRGGVSAVEAMKVSVDAVRVLIKAVEPIVIVGELNEAVRV